MNVLWVPHVSWGFPQRCKAFCRWLAERHSVHVTNVNTYFGFRDYLGLDYVRGFFYRRWVDDGITVHDIPRFSPALYSRRLRELNNKVFLKHVNRIVREEGIDCVVGSFMCPPPECENLVLDVCDDHPAFWREMMGREEYAREIGGIQRGYVGRTDKVVVVGEVLSDRLGFPGARVIPNAVDVDLFSRASGEEVRGRVGAGKKIIGLFGNHDSSEELSLLIEAAEMVSNPDVVFLVVGRGSAVGKAAAEKSARGLDNVVFVGQVPYEQMPEYYKALDVGLCLKRPSVFWDASCPMKVIEATAAGKRVVSTRLKQVVSWGLHNVSYTDFDAKSLADAVEKALESGAGGSEKIRSFDIENLGREYEGVITA
ncbi:MAG: glycosyltransferase family 4 protein [Candidatus Altiarchaeota archaeon]